MMRIKNWIIILCIVLCQSAFAAEPVEVDAQGLERLMASGVKVIDVRTPGEWKQTGIVEGSIPIMFFDEQRKPHAQEWMHQASMHIMPDTPVAIICRSGKRSKAVGVFLIKQYDYKDVYNVTGGIIDWMAKGNKTVAAN